MSKYSIEESTLTSIADKVRTLRGTTGALTPEQLASQIQAEANLGKVKLETCTITFRMLVDYIDLSYSQIVVRYLDSAGQYCAHRLCDAPSVNVVKGSIVYISTDAMWPIYSYSGQYSEVYVAKASTGVFVVNGDMTIVIDYD